MIAAAQVGVQTGSEHFRQHTNWRTATMNPAQEAGMYVSKRIGQNIPGKFTIDRRNIFPLFR